MSPKANEPIAIVGSACRFAGDASSPSKLWNVLQNPKDLLQKIPESRFNADAFYHPDGSYHGHSNVKHAYLLNEELTGFDSEFFGIKAVEAKAMDPQQRLLMETTYEGLEAAGMPITRLKGSDTAVYVGVMFNDYACMLLRDFQDIPTYYATGTGQSILSNRISYFFDWHGPSVTIDTACSSSLVAVHMAIQALRSGDSRMAVACGSNLILDPMNFVIESKLKMLSPDGRSRMWDQDANGYARGEGVATLVLKTLSDAIADGDHIECIIKETALNQDGATGGITMPSPSAQEALIRSTYAKAGLDLLSAKDRPQYFEAHGTGTPAGDPTEAEAVYNAFWSKDAAYKGLELNGGNPLYVGSIKTILGHTEGTAGVAAILKTSLSLQNRTIPPNLLFEKLSDRVSPFYKNVEILRSAKAWPVIEGAPRRASVNSFGFGGANAHAILEHYDNVPSTTVGSSNLFTPFVFSAFSEKTLRANLCAFRDYLLEKPEISVHDLAYTLRERRSLFPYRVSFAASSVEELGEQISAKLSDENAIGTKSTSASKRGEAKILGVFTGQGAQYARMGAELIETSATASKIIDELESDLAQLPDGPAWSLKAEILAAASSSRINEAILSQPLCTALQILLIDLLHLAGIHFEAVVGHSSGEIAAAYAAGHLTARDAIYIAYYRGVHVQNSSSPNGTGIKGSMIAVGSSLEDITELCEDEAFKGRLSVAASNSSSSVTVSGDEDAIVELQVILDDEKKFNRLLKVDKAYHSSHMLPCYEPYVASLKQCGVQAQTPRTACTWYSSVYNRPVDSSMNLADTYWAENMTQPVLFTEALSTALAADTYDLALEVGAHPALKGPATQTIQEALNKEIPYSGILSRGASAVEASATGLGFLWSHLDKTNISLDAYERDMTGSNQNLSVVKGLPTYQWNHENKYWHESRTSRKMRSRPHPVHSLLGDMTPDAAPHHLTWKNLLRESQMEWVSGHKVQSQTVFPAAGYLTTALEASRFVAGTTDKTIRLIEVKDFIIHQALVFSQDDSGIEVVTSMADIIRDNQDRITAKFTYSAAMDTHAEDLTLVASAEIEIQLGEASSSLLPARKPALTHVIDVEPERFYSALAELGYEFGGRFRSLSALQRKHYKATCLMKVRPIDDGAHSLFIHPAELDAALQSVILAYSYPYDEQLRNLHLPTTIQHIRINPSLLGDDRNQVEFYPVDSTISPRQPGQRGIFGHVEVYSEKSSNAAIQIQGATFMPLGAGAAEEDRRVFSRVHWVDSHADGIEAGKDIPLTESHRDTVRLLERIATFYLRKFHKEVPADHPIRDEFTTKWYLNYARYITDMVESGQHKWAQKEWLNDTVADIMEASKPFMHLPDVQIMHITGQQMPRVFNGETTILEQFRATDILDRYYAGGFGLRESGQWVSRTVKQLTDRYPHMNILEVGAGTGGATKAIFREIGQSFKSYTYTDISAAFFENAAANFSQHRDRMIFKTYDAEKDAASQGFIEGTYDLIVAFFVIHATSDLERALRHIRKMLRPGGFLVVGEGQEGMNGVASSGFIFGTLPGWWLGTDTGRVLSPHVSPQEWDELLKKTGFSGVDSCPRQDFEDVLNVFHFSSQAVDEEVRFFREPLALPSSASPIKKLVIVGGETERSASLVDGVQSLLGQGLASEIYTYKSLVDVDYNVIDNDTTVASFTELDEPIFKSITPKKFEAFRTMFQSDKNLLWITSGRRDDEPYSNMTVGFGRVATHETPGLRLQQLDIADPAKTTPQTIAEILVRFHADKSKSEELLWAVEPEIVVDEHDRQLVARLRPIPKLNDRYNSARRTIVHDTDVSDVDIALQHTQSGYMIKEQSSYELALAEHHSSEELIELHTSHAILSALKTKAGYKFLIIGAHQETKKQYLALVSNLSSVVKVPIASVYAIDSTTLSEEGLITATAAQIVATTALAPLFPGQTIVAHNVSKGVAAAISAEADEMGIDVVFTSDSKSDIPDSWFKLPEYLGRHDLDDVLLAKPSAFIGLSSGETQALENEATIISNLPADCLATTAKTAFALNASDNARLPVAVFAEILQRAVFNAQKTIETSHSATTVHLDNLTSGDIPQDPLAVVDWRAVQTLPVHAARLDTSPMFKSTNATYWIVGMAGALGISLCDWMINNGARNLVVTSRNPKIAPEWIAAHKRKGATVTVLPCDVTNEEALKSVHQEICRTLPPIVGAMNGAMVLRDVSIRNMSFSELSDVIRPKVLGSIYLDRIFYDVDLDFFLLISSINCVIGNLGQANYAAANTFMCSLAAQRRKRGLRAATMNGGAIMGAGYMERESRRALDLIVQKLHMMRMSEEDWNQSIGEGIDASRLDSIAGPELTTGLSDVPYDTPNAPYWFLNPMFSSFIVQQKADSLVKNEGKATASIQELLQACASKDDARVVIEKAFAAQLRNALQMTMSDEDLLAARSAEIGLDSLVSVDIRSWFLKNVQVSIPVLKIMGDDTMANIVQYAVDNVPAELMPLIAGAATDDDCADASTSEDSSSVEGVFTGLKGSEVPTASTTPMPERSPSADGGILKVTAAGGIDWEAEARPTSDLAQLPRISEPAPVTPPKVVVLTGASGLLGHHLLNYLLERTEATKIYCPAVRRLSSKLANKELPQNDRVEYFEGQLADPLLGLPPQKAVQIFNVADLVIHNGADTSHLKYFQDLRDSNVGSTQTLTRLCLPRRIPIHYVSSAGLAVLFKGPAFPPVRMTGREHSYPTSDGVFGYMSSKWTNERYLEQVHEQYGLPICIHRPSTILREGADAVGMRAQLDWVNALLHWARAIEAVPQIKNNTGALDLVRISTACESILSHVLDGSEKAKTEVRYAHQVGDIVLPMENLQEIGREEGKKFAVLPMGEWLAKAVAAGLHPAIATLIEMMDAPGAPDYPRILRDLPAEA